MPHINTAGGEPMRRLLPADLLMVVCCDYGRECCPDCHSGNADHLGERGGCKRIDPRDIPAELRIGPCRIGGRFFCTDAFGPRF